MSLRVEADRATRPGSDRRWESIVPVLIGIVAFLVVCGPKIINPQNIGWLGGGDPTTHYLGWMFFRNAAWHLPLGLNPDYGLEFGNSILFSDSNPLLAIAFKPFANWLPATFQYFGIWLLTCFVLQVWFAWKLTGLLTVSTLQRGLASALFAFAPPMIWRLNGHLSLVGHFLIMAALFLCIRPVQRHRVTWWAVLIGATALVHAYLLAMVGAVWVASFVTCTSAGRRSRSAWRKRALEFFVILAVVAVCTWQAGYFTIDGIGNASGTFFYRMNLLSIVDSSGWSRILPDIAQNEGDYEGFNYLGLGELILGIFAIAAILSSRARVTPTIVRNIPLLSVCIALTALAMTTRVSVADHEYGFKLPDQAAELLSVFRACGRLFWPVFYVVTLLFIVAVIRGYKRRSSTALLALALVAQVADTSVGWRDFHRQMAQQSSSKLFASPLTDPLWNELATHYSAIRMVEPRNLRKNYAVFGDFAARHRLSTNSVYLARVDDKLVAAAAESAADALATGSYDPHAIYILDDDLVIGALGTLRNTDLINRMDGFNVIAPNWRLCAECTQRANFPRIEELRKSVALGQRVDLTTLATGAGYLSGGWYPISSFGAWASRPTARLVIPVTGQRPSQIALEATAFTSPEHPVQRVLFRVSGGPTVMREFHEAAGNIVTLDIPRSLPGDLDAHQIDVEAKSLDRVSPAQLGLSIDTRLLSFGIVGFTLR